MDRLHNIICGRSEEDVLDFIDNTPFCHALDENGGNYLHVCCSSFRLNCVDTYGSHYKEDNDALMEKLIQKGVDWNGRDNMLRTPLHCFCLYFDNWIIGQYLDKKGDVESPYLPYRLVEAGADVNAKDIYGRTPIFYCRDARIAEYLYSQGAKLETRDVYGMTPMFVCKSLEMLDFYAKHNCDFNVVDVWGRNALAECDRWIREKFMKEFRLQEMPENDKDVTMFSGTYAYECKMKRLNKEKNYIARNKDDILKSVSYEESSADVYSEDIKLYSDIEEDDVWDCAPIMSYGSFEETVRMLQDEIPSRECRKSAERALLMQVEELTAETASRYRSSPPYFGNSKSAYVNERIKVIQLLIDAEVDLNYADTYGQTAVFRCKRPQYLMQLLCNGAKLSIRDKDGKSPLWIYATSNPNSEVDEEDALEIIRILLEYGLDPNETDFYGRPLLIEVRSSENYRYAENVRKLLLEYGADSACEAAYKKQVKAALQRHEEVWEKRTSYSDFDLAEYYGYDSISNDEDEYSREKFLDDL